jgi:phosphoenolpyruvate synthase/pyruvate phosphate dikinase
MSSTVPPEFIEKWKQNPIVEWAIKQIENKPTYKSELQNVPNNTFEYWNAIKRIIGDTEGEELKGMKGFSSNAATKVRNRMVDEMDLINPDYENARNIAEREFTRKDLENVFDKKDMTLNNFWSLLKSDKAFNKVMRKLEPFPEAKQKLKDIRLLSNDIIPFDESIRTSYKLERTGMSKDRNKLDALKRDLDERFGGEHDVAAVNLMTNPDWVNILTEYLKKQGK